MMRNTITRTLAVSEITAYKLTIEDGQPKADALPTITVPGKASQKEAIKAVQKVYGKDAAVTVGNIVVHEDVYEISVDDFMKYAKKVDKAAETPAN